jgi:hypothetical protein
MKVRQQTLNKASIHGIKRMDRNDGPSIGGEMMKKKLLISCGILQPEIEVLINSGAIDAEAVYLNKFLHMNHQKLHDALKDALNRYRQRSPVVVYGDLCLGFKGEMHTLLAGFEAIKVDGLNCIDCLLGGRGKLLEIDPDHRFFFLTPAFIDFSESLITGTMKENRRRFNMLKGIIIVDPLGDMDQCLDRIEHFSNQTGLPILSHKVVGLSGPQKRY